MHEALVSLNIAGYARGEWTVSLALAKEKSSLRIYIEREKERFYYNSSSKGLVSGI